MTQSPKNRAIIAVAGARKTQTIVEAALAVPSRRVLVTTYTIQNMRQLERRIAHHAGGVSPPNVTITTWFSLLLSEFIRPYQDAVFDQIGLVHGLNFVGRRFRFATKALPRRFFLDTSNDVYRNEASDLAFLINEVSGGKVIRRLEAMYDHIYVDEVQDLVGYDLDLLDLLFKSSIEVTVVGDPRQYIFATNDGPRHKKFRGIGLLKWLGARAQYCEREVRNVSYRCNQAICDFANGLFPDIEPMRSGHSEKTEHDGIFHISAGDVATYVTSRNSQILRHSQSSDTFGLPAMNFGVSKGSTFPRVLVVPTTPMRAYLKTSDPSKLKDPQRFYVAVTRAQHSVAFVVT